MVFYYCIEMNYNLSNEKWEFLWFTTFYGSVIYIYIPLYTIPHIYGIYIWYMVYIRYTYTHILWYMVYSSMYVHIILLCYMILWSDRNWVWKGTVCKRAWVLSTAYFSWADCSSVAAALWREKEVFASQKSQEQRLSLGSVVIY